MQAWSACVQSNDMAGLSHNEKEDVLDVMVSLLILAPPGFVNHQDSCQLHTDYDCPYSSCVAIVSYLQRVSHGAP